MSLVEEIYDGLTDDEAFAALPGRLAGLVNARSCTLQALGPTGDLQILAFCHFTPQMYERYLGEEMYRRDPWRGPFAERARLNRACLSSELVSRDEYLRSEFYNAFFRPFGDDTGHCVGVVMPHREGVGEWGFHRPLNSEPFAHHERDLMQALVPHVRRLLTLKCTLALGKQPGGNADAVLDALPHAVLVLDHLGGLLFANRRGETMLGPIGPLTVNGGGVRAREPRANARLADLVLAAGLGVGGRGGAMTLPAGEARSFRVVVTPWRQGGATRVIVLIDDPDARDVSLSAKLAGLYGLTAAEAETVAALAEGLSPAEAADARGVSLATIRTQIHQALRKSDSRTLADLVRLAASLPRLGAPD